MLLTRIYSKPGLGGEELKLAHLMQKQSAPQINTPMNLYAMQVRLEVQHRIVEVVQVLVEVLWAEVSELTPVYFTIHLN